MICLSFDVEERFHSHLASASGPRQWKARERIAHLIDLLLAHRRTATFFIVGELAERYPDLVRRIAESGFEIGSHSYSHLRMDAGNRAACIEDISRSKDVLEQISGAAVVGYRSPTWTASLGDDWLWDHLITLGFRYDSSLFPVRTHLYGSYDNPVRPFRLRPQLLEIPPSVWARAGVRLPYGGGFYFRIYPGWLTRWFIDSDLRCDRSPVVYMHPWDFEVERDRIETGRLNRFIGNVNAGRSWERLSRLVARYPTRSLANLCASLTADGDGAGRA
jgi:polysaccharide deacetylase family protein (PEP-CTERM system associated)